MAKVNDAKTVFGAAVGVLMLETSFPRMPGDVGNAQTWPFPVLYKVVRGATGDRVKTARAGEGSSDLLDLFVDAGRELVHMGADGLTTSCGFLSIYQEDLADRCGVPVAASALMQIPMVQRALPRGKVVGVITIDASLLTEAHFVAVGARPDTPRIGLEGRSEIQRVQANNEHGLDVDAAIRDVVEAGDDLLKKYPEVGAVVLECTNLPPYASILRDHLGLPVFGLHSLVTWFQSGLDPRRFGSAPT